MNRKRNRTLGALVGMVLLLCILLLLTGQENASKRLGKTHQASTPEPTSKAHPTQVAEQDASSPGHNIALIQQLLYQSNRELKVVHRADGSRLVRLGGQHQHASAARRLPDGTLVISCFDSVEPMLQFMGYPPKVNSNTSTTHEVAER